jgi:hypothetical protein
MSSSPLASSKYKVTGKMGSFIYLTPCVPLSFEGEGEVKKDGLCSS